MATRSRIAIENENGSVNSIYCHFDGYVDGVGAELQANYTDRSKVEELIALGDISVLRPTIETTEAYHRDRGEDKHSTSYLSVEDLFNLGFESSIEYIYCLTKDNKWLVSSGGPVANLFVALEGEDVL
jgi:hypothetical protein